jgi:hypothetical protein
MKKKKSLVDIENDHSRSFMLGGHMFAIITSSIKRLLFIFNPNKSDFLAAPASPCQPPLVSPYSFFALVSSNMQM